VSVECNFSVSRKMLKHIKFNWQLIFNGLLLLFRFSGLCPILISKKKHFCITFMLIIWSVVQLIGVGVTIEITVKKFFANPGLANVNNVLTFSIIMLTHAVTIVESVIVRKNFIYIWKNIASADELISGMVSNFNEILMKFNKNISIRLTGYILMTILLELGVIIRVADDEDWTYMWCICILSLTISRLRHLQHSLFINVLSCRFRIIKHELEDIVKLTNLEGNQLIVKNSTFYDGLFDKISSIKKVYNILWETSLLINRSFGFSQLANLLQNFIHLTCLLYSTYSFLYYNNFEDLLGKLFIEISWDGFIHLWCL